MKIQKHREYTTLPKRIFEDNTISLQAKGYYACMMSGINVEDEESFNELLSHGYIKYTRGDYTLLVTPITKIEEVKEEEFPFLEEPKKTLVENKPRNKMNLYETMVELVKETTPYEEERKLLVEYFKLRFHPKLGSKFSKISSAYQVRLVLDSLKDCTDNMIGSIQQSIDKQWAKFYPCKKVMPTSRDNISSSSFTKEELEDIKSTKETF